MWWLTYCGVWIKTPGNVDIAIDFWVQRGEHTKKQLPYKQIKDAQIIRMTGARKYPPFLRCSPHVIDPFAGEKTGCGALHAHPWRPYLRVRGRRGRQEHERDLHRPAKMCGEHWESWGVPEKRIVRTEAGPSYKIKDTEIFAVESFDRTALITPPPEGDLRGKMP